MKPNNVDPHNPAKVIPHDPDDFQHAHMLDDLQGNILKGHGRHHTAHIFLKFGEDPTQARKWIQKFHFPECQFNSKASSSILRTENLDKGVLFLTCA